MHRLRAPRVARAATRSKINGWTFLELHASGFHPVTCAPSLLANLFTRTGPSLSNSPQLPPKRSTERPSHRVQFSRTESRIQGPRMKTNLQTKRPRRLRLWTTCDPRVLVPSELTERVAARFVIKGGRTLVAVLSSVKEPCGAPVDFVGLAFRQFAEEPLRRAGGHSRSRYHSRGT